MGQAVSSDVNITNILKTWYTDEAFQSLLFRNSPTMARIKALRIGGKNYGISMLYGRGGAVSGDWTVAVANSATTSRNAEMLVPPGKIFSVFNINQFTILAGQDGNGTKANYIKPITDLMFAATEAQRKTTAAALFGTGYGELGIVGAVGAGTPLYGGGGNGVTQVGANTVLVTSDVAIKLDIGTVFSVTNSGVSLLPSATLRTSVNTVTAIGSVSPGTTLYPVTFTATAIETWVSTDWIELSGSRDGSGNPNLPTGLGGWLPWFFNRTGATWTTYIGTAFYGVNRSVAVDRLAGNFYVRNVAGSETYSNTLLEGIRLARRAGGVPDVIVVNDLDYKQILMEVNAQTQYFQSADGKGAIKPDITKGASAININFATSFVEKLVEDPYCPIGTAYILDSSIIEFVGFSRTEQIMDDGVPNNEPGRPDVDTVTAPDTVFNLVIDDWLNVQPGSGSSDGPAAQVTLGLYGNWVVRNPASCVVVRFLAS